jgi:hypothetical protein
MAESLTVSWTWEPRGQVRLAGGLLVFPAVSAVGGAYRLTCCTQAGALAWVYIGESQTLRGRFQHYRTPGADKKLTMARLNQAMTDALKTGGTIAVEVVTRTEVVTGGAPPAPLDLSSTAGRVLVERAAEVMERTAGSPLLNK